MDEFQDIESELMKRGTLAHGLIRWPWLGEQAAALLQTQAKDFRLLSTLLQAVANSPAEPRLPFGTALAARFLTLWGANAYPRGRGRAPHLLRVVETVETLVAKAGGDFNGVEELAACKTALHACANALAEIGPDLGVRLAVLPARLEEEVSARQTACVQKRAELDSISAAISPPARRPPSEPAPKPESLRLDASNERALKQSLSTLADFLLSLDLANPLSYRLRRFATWYGIVSAPPIKSGMRTVLQAVSDDIAETYRTAAERGQTSHDIAQKLERSCHLQPFWLDGQMIAHRLARVCGRDAVARAIKEEVTNFVGTIPGLDEFSFSNGAAILPPEVAAWLGSVDLDKGALQASQMLPQHLDHASPSFEHDMARIVQEARAMESAGDLAGALTLLDRAQVSKGDNRGKAMLELVMLECLNDWGMKSHACAQATRLRQTISQLTVAEWEPGILGRIGKLAKTVGKYK